jgi:predicted DNA-binding transcriptional regulator AlpA
MAGRKLTARKPDLIRPAHSEPPPSPPAPRMALSIIEFCEAFGISEDFFYKLKRQGQTPKLMKVGKRTMISMEAANEWRIERETASVEA